MQYINEEQSRVRKPVIWISVVVFFLAVVLVAFFLISRERRALPLPTGIPPRVEDVPRPTVDPIPQDRDRDGLTNEEEAALGTSETEFDTDFDGLSDVDEIRVWQTDPKKFDTDGDGYGDGVEVIRGFNPKGKGQLPSR